MRIRLNPEKICALRRARAQTQEELADDAGIGVRTLQRIERGALVNARTAADIAQVLQVAPTEIRASEQVALEERTRGHVVLVASTKGGTGRTTLAVSLAGLFLATNCRVCLVDFSRSRGVSYYLNRALLLRQNVPSYTFHTGPVEAARTLAGLRLAFDQVVIDGSAYEDDDLLPLANMADRVLLTTDHPKLDLGNAARLRMWRAAARVRDTISIVHTRASQYERHRRDNLTFLRQIGLPVCQTILHSRSAYEYAFSQGQPVTVNDPCGLASSEIRQLAHEFGWAELLTSQARRDRRRTRIDHLYLRAALKDCLIR